VIAVSSPEEKEREWAAENLEGATIYSDYDEMLEKEDLQAVVVASVTAVHAEQSLKAIEKGYHVLCEKPLSIDVDIVGSSIPFFGCFLCFTSY
jgi:myo-inositol 2-dehydrogenase/D-chiro-inositol 1-dehydrogenase